MNQTTSEKAAELAPCPFCGMKPPEDLIDTLYPNGTWWREDDFGRIYRSHPKRKAGDRPCMTMHCTENMGGCGAEITADTEDEVRAKWNARASLAPQGAQAVQPEAMTELSDDDIAQLIVDFSIMDSAWPTQKAITAFVRASIAATGKGAE